MVDLRYRRFSIGTYDHNLDEWVEANTHGSKADCLMYMGSIYGQRGPIAYDEVFGRAYDRNWSRISKEDLAAMGFVKSRYRFLTRVQLLVYPFIPSVILSALVRRTRWNDDDALEEVLF